MMYDFDTINYSIRPNKIIQRTIAFDALDLAKRHIELNDAAYIGFGSVWFSDFIIAHKRLGVSEMISIEKNPVLAARARFNAPFRTLRVFKGDAGVVIKRLVRDRELMRRPWIVWLDYTVTLTQEVVEDIDFVTDRAPPNSILLVTVNSKPRNYGTTEDRRRDHIRRMLGDVVPADASPARFTNARLPWTIADFANRHILSRTKSFGRPGAFIPAFAIPYRDGTEMLTFGGILAKAKGISALASLTRSSEWPGFPSVSVETPPLTMKEAGALQTLLPTGTRLTRQEIKLLGFDLESDKLKVFSAHYRRYPYLFQAVG